MPSVTKVNRAHGQRARDPAVPLLLPEGGDREREGHREGREAREHHGRMDHHPGVLQQRVQPDAVLRRRRREQLERALPAEDRDDPEEAREVDDHHRRLELLRAAPDDQADQRAPEAPEQERALLPSPEGGDEEVERQVAARVGVDVGDVEAVLEQKGHQHRRGRDDARREGRVEAARERQQFRAAVGAPVGRRRSDPREKGSPDGGHAGPEVVGAHGEGSTTGAPPPWPTCSSSPPRRPGTWRGISRGASPPRRARSGSARWRRSRSRP